MISHGPTVLFTGGEYSLGKSDWNRDVWTYDTITSKWKACAPLETCRRHHSVCVSEERGEAYLVGGYSTHRKRLMRMERVDLRPASRDEVPEDPDLDLPREFKKPSRIVQFRHEYNAGFCFEILRFCERIPRRIFACFLKFVQGAFS